MELMCKDTRVYSLDDDRVYAPALLPGLMQRHPSKQTFVQWMEKRYSERSNTYARTLRAYVFGQGNRGKIDETTNAFSLSDCYWIRYRDKSLHFAERSPYFQDFWQGHGDYNGEPVPTLYVNGYLSKYWRDSQTLIKSREKHEIMCANLAHALEIRAVRIEDDADGIAVQNFTSPDCMFESAEASGRIDADAFTAEDILTVFGEPGFDMVFFDALIGNGDRHAGNFGFLRDANSGAYLGMAPLFDFDHAMESRSADDILIREVHDHKDRYSDRFHALVARAQAAPLEDYFRLRLLAML